MKKAPIRLRAVLHFATPPKRCRRHSQPRSQLPPTDLFGGIVVTHADVATWLRAVPKLDPTNPRAAAYVKNYDVVGKIIEAKRRGEFMRPEAANDAG